ncbi:Protein phosphatase PP2A regulatory subunit A AltName: Full=Protein phosphatase 2A 65 kDa regulatory subunit; Short=PR65 [Serendipita indica DSM 11827]|nr:Protein phosphatase PP2A regulatory subunit A AltName: Full=Protein phosphatase 2A 65 kDa regulatory subunit; Short=PR65 [Serendipita indica DSM 11827]
MDPTPAEELYPIAILMDELKSDDTQLRLNAIHRLSTIALALGPVRAREDLIPFLQDNLDDEDEVLLALAEELGKGFDEYIGGPEHAHLLLAPLASLAEVEETLVRDKAAESITTICGILSASQIEQHYIPLVFRLCHGDWFTSRTSSAALFSPVYPKATAATQEDLRKSFAKLGSDDTPMVRRAAAKWLGPLVKTMKKEHVITEALPIYRRLAMDDQDSVRLLTIQDLIAIAQQLTPAEVKDHLLTQIRQSLTDKSWRVRYMVSNNFVDLANAVGPDLVKEELVTAFVSLLKDNEAEVRTAGAAGIPETDNQPGFSKLVDRDTILNQILPCVRDLSTDASQHVRAALGTHISGLAPLLGKEATIEHLLPLFLHLLKDEFPDVRLNIISKLEQVNNGKFIGIELLSQSLLPAIVELASDKQWRVRQAIIEYIPLLAQQLGMAFFDEQLSNLCMSWLGDIVFSIREAATVNLKKLIDVFGVEWARQAIVPRVVAMATHPNYLYRMTTIFAISAISPSLNVQVLRDDVLDTVIRLAADPIPNIRFNVAKTLDVITTVMVASPEGQEVTKTTILPTLPAITRG